MAISGFKFVKHLGWHWVGHFCPPICTNGLKKHSSCLVGPYSCSEAFFPVWTSSCQPRAVTIASLLMGGCSLRHEHVEDGCKSTCVILAAETLTELQNWGYGKFNACMYAKSDP